MLGIIGGSGLYQLDTLTVSKRLELANQYGKPSSELVFAHQKDKASNTESDKDFIDHNLSDLCFITRHGSDHSIPPHKINYRANIQALVDAGVDRIVSVNAVGSCNAKLAVGQLLMPEQIIDYSYGREHSFFDRLEDFSNHIDFSLPFCPALQRDVQAAAKAVAVDIPAIIGTYACTQGPRLETAAEVKRLINDGCDVIGMTVMPEAALARERGLAYVSLSVVVNPAAGMESDTVLLDDIPAVLDAAMLKVGRIIAGMV